MCRIVRIFPRLFCLGPIEVATLYFAKSLSRQFPRLFCLGPIEVCTWWTIGPMTLWFPRLFCLGPIEVKSLCCVLLDPSLISEAFLPRPHWSTLDGNSDITGLSISEAFLPRPHWSYAPQISTNLLLPNFRGFFASAPLKFASWWCAKWTLIISEAFLPRPHWSIPMWDVNVALLCISEAFLPRPHWSNACRLVCSLQFEFPRLFCLGPIEVRIIYWHTPRLPTFPRLFCLGPIEVRLY